MRILGLLLILTTALPAMAAYDDEEGGGSAVVIQNRRFRMQHEFTLEAGLLPLDAFFKGVTATARYTLHFGDFHAWEIAAGTYSFNFDTGLTDQLRNNFGVTPQRLPALQLMIESDYVMRPVYGKYALFNRAIIYSEVFVAAGITVSYWNDNSFRPGPNLGLGARVFVTEWLSFRLDVRHAVVFNGIPVVSTNWAMDQVFYAGIGASIGLGGGE
jgi:outer membrane beta-barrel protein